VKGEKFNVKNKQPGYSILDTCRLQMNYPAANCGVSEDRNGMIIPPHPTLSRKGRGNNVTPQLAAGNRPDSRNETNEK